MLIDLLKKPLQTLVQYQHVCSIGVRGSSIAYYLLLINMLQIATISTLAGDFNGNTGDMFFIRYLHFISYSNLPTWANARTLMYFFVAYISALFILQLLMVIHAVKGKFDETVRIVHFLSLHLQTFFEYLIYIPFLTWAFFKFDLQNFWTFHNGITAGHIDKSPTWLFVILCTLFGISCLLHLCIKITLLPFRQLHQDRLKGVSNWFTLYNLAFQIVLIVFASQSQRGSISPKFTLIGGLLYSLGLILMDFKCWSFKHPVSKKFHLFLAAAYFAHSIFLITKEALGVNKGTKYIGVMYFVVTPLIIKGVLTILQFLWKENNLRGKTTCPGRIQREELNEILDIFYTAEHPPSIKTTFRQKMFIAQHLRYCKNSSCFCVKSAANERYTYGGEITYQEALDFMERYIEEVLTQNLRSKHLDHWFLVDFAILQGLCLDKPLQACINLARLKAAFSGRYQRFVLTSLFLIIEERFKEKLGYLEKELQTVKFSDGIEFDREYHKVLASYDKIQSQTSHFYRYLVENTPVSLDSVYKKGRGIINLICEAENRIERLIKVNSGSIEAVSLLINVKSTMLDQSKNSLNELKSRLNLLHAKKQAQYKDQHSELTKFTTLDYENIYAIIDLTGKVGQIKDYNSRLLADLDFPEHQFQNKNVMISQFLPIGVGAAVEKHLKGILRDINSNSIPQNYLPLTFLSDSQRFLVPCEACLKVELFDDYIVGAAALKKLENHHNYILTTASGQIISFTKNFLSSFGLKSEGEIVGVNICFIIPELVRHYVDLAEEDEKLYPVEGKISGLIDAYGCHHEKALFIQRASIETDANAMQMLMMKLDEVERGSFINKDLGATIIKRFRVLAEELEFELSTCYEVRLKVHKYEIGSERFKLVEVIRCKPLQENTKAFFIRKNSKISHMLEHDSRLGVSHLGHFEDETGHLINFSSMNFASPTSREARVEYTRRDTFSQFHEQQQTDRELLPPTLHTNRIKRCNLLSSLKSPEEVDLNITPKVNFHRMKAITHSDEGSFDISANPPGLKSLSRSDDQAKTLSARIIRCEVSLSSQTSSTSNKSTASLSIRYLLLNKTNYRILKLNLFIGFIGIIIIQALYSAQYAGYKQRLDDLALLCTSISYPTQLGLDQQMLVKDYYKWELVRNQILVPTSWFDDMVRSITFPAYINVGKSFFTLMANANNVSREVSTYISDHSNFVEFSFLQGDPLNMSLAQAIVLHWEASLDYYNDVVVEAEYLDHTYANAFILIENTDRLYDKMIELNADLAKISKEKINNILNFNLLMIIVVSIITAVLILCCEILLQNMTKKRIEMLSLMVRIPKADLIREWQKIDHERANLHATKEQLTTNGQGTHHKYKGRSTFIYKSTNRRSQVFILVALVCISWVPFITWYTQTRDQINDWSLGLDQIDLMGDAQAAITTLVTLHFKYYYHLNATEEVKEKINRDIGVQLSLAKKYTNLLTEFMTSFGKLSNQDAYDANSSAIILNGKTDLCANTQHTDSFIALCYQATGGIGGEGLIQSMDYLLSHAQEIYTTVHQAQDQNLIFSSIGKKEDLLNLEFFQVCINRYLRVASDLMTLNFISFMGNVGTKAKNTFIGISILILLVLGAGWVSWIKQMEKWLNRTKDIYRILTLTILEGNSFIKSYFTKELKESEYWFC